MAGIGLLVRIVYQVYCHRNFSESRYQFALRKDLLKRLGKVCRRKYLLRCLASCDVRRISFGDQSYFWSCVKCSLCHCFATENSILSFAMNVYKAISPQITKTYASDEMEHHKALVYTGSKMAVYMLYLIFFLSYSKLTILCTFG